MRNPDRIYKFLQTLTEAWSTSPDLRFGQIFENIKRYSGKSDLFYIEDEELEQLIIDFFDLEALHNVK